jgi:hypothetical protein
MGGNRYNRRNYFSDEEIMKLVDQTMENPLRSLSPNKNKEYDSYIQWRYSLPFLFDEDSLIRFLSELDARKGKNICHYCGIVIPKSNYRLGGGYPKFCPDCQSKQVFKRIDGCLSETSRKNRGANITKSKLAFYKTERGEKAKVAIGAANSRLMSAFYQTEKGKIQREKNRIRQREVMISKILKGEFTPKSNNRRTHWGASCNGKSFRSSWEALYFSFHPTDFYEKLRIPYEFNDKMHVYVVDFVNYENKIITEIKPEELRSQPQFKAKQMALLKWASEHGFAVQIIGIEEIVQFGIPDYSNFDQKTAEKVRRFYEKTRNQIN